MNWNTRRAPRKVASGSACCTVLVNSSTPSRSRWLYHALAGRGRARWAGLPETRKWISFRSFSGGWQMRAELARALISQPDILLLDEPSNYLDLPAVEWLRRAVFARAFSGTMLLIFHDRYLLRTLTDRTVEVSGGEVVRYEGGYDYYLVERQRRWGPADGGLSQLHGATGRDRNVCAAFPCQGHQGRTGAEPAQAAGKTGGGQGAARAAGPFAAACIAEPPHCGARVLSLHNAGFTYNGQRWIFRNVDLEINRGEKVAVVGYNGLGKTTLLRVLASALTLKEGARIEGHQVVVGYQSQDFAETMPPDQSVSDRQGSQSRPHRARRAHTAGLFRVQRRGGRKTVPVC